MVRKLFTIVAVLTCIAMTNTAFAADEAAGGNQEIENHFVAPMKNIQLNDDGSWSMDFGGTLRARGEYWNNFAWGGSGDRSDTFSLWRALIYSDIHIGDNIRVFGEMVSALQTDRSLPGGTTTLNVNSIDIHQAYADFSGDLNDMQLTFRVGRQEYSFGKQRLVSPLPWANTMRTWDGFTLITEGETWNVTGFWSQFVPVRKYDFDQADSGSQFFGVYGTSEKLLFEYDMDLYLLGQHLDALDGGGGPGETRRYTAGGRVFGNISDSPYDFDIEGGYQFGKLATDMDINAYFFAAESGYTWEYAECKPRFFVGFDYASGDKDASGTAIGGKTFSQLFPLGHAFLGYIDAIGRQNVIDVNLGVTAKPTEKLTVRIAGYYFWKAQEQDAIYNAGGGVIRPGAAGTSNDIGAEIDLTAKYKISKHWTGLIGYSHFFAGKAIDDAAVAGVSGNDDIDFSYIQLQCNF